MPTALAAIMEGDRSNFRTIFYAHEVAPMRRIVDSFRRLRPKRFGQRIRLL